MEQLERLWDSTTHFFGNLLSGFERGITGLFGSSNARYVKKLQGKVDAITALESRFESMTDDELREQTESFKQRIRNGETTDDIMIEAFAVCREGGKRFLEMRHYDVQMVGGMVLHSGAVAEMVTGEGKTLVATLPAYLNALCCKGVHVVTVNDYLARRDMEWMAPLYMGLGLSVGAIQSNMPVSERQQAYAKDITYGTNNEFGFDYLRDNMRPAARGDDRFEKPRQQSQGPLAFAIIDEVDNILIDEARTPLIISGPAHQNPARYFEANKIATQLKKEVHYQVNEKDHTATLTDEGVRYAEKLAGVESFYTAGNMDWPHMIDNALKAHGLYKKDVNYVVKEGAIVIVDEFTGRLMDGRQWSDGLHQAVEAKEGVKIKEETQTLATITLQNYFKLYEKICGMTGTAMTEAEEFHKIYELNVVAIPTNRPLQRIPHPDVIYSGEKHKWAAIAEEVENYHQWDMVFMKNGDIFVGKIKEEGDSEVVLSDKVDGAQHRLSRNKIEKVQYKGRPILVGTVSIEKSEIIAGMLERRGIKHEVLNAKNHKREADIVAQAGRMGGVTIATNMAGRGTDIVLGGNPETMAWARLQDTYPTRLDVPQDEWDELVKSIDNEHKMKEMGEEVKKIGGLHVIGSERHDARRIDLQLRGRCGRQGDPGSSRFFLSLDDDLMRIFAGPFVKRVLEMGGFTDDVPIESRMVSRRIDAAQKKREEYNFEIRKSLLEYDEVMDEQRKRIYSFRQRILDGVSCREIVQDMIQDQVETNLQTILAEDFGAESFARYAEKQLTIELDPRLFRKATPEEAVAICIDEAERQAETDILAQIDVCLAVGEDESEWNWGALAHFANARWNINVRDKDLKNTGRDLVDELLINKARVAIRKAKIEGADQMLDPNYGVKTAAGWVEAKFGIKIDPTELRDISEDSSIDLVNDHALEKYDEKEAVYPVMAGMYKFVVPAAGGAQGRIDREGLTQWASRRFESEITLDNLKNKQREEIREILLNKSKHSQKEAQGVIKSLQSEIEHVSESGGVPLLNANGVANRLTDWFKSNLDYELELEAVERLEKEELEQKLEAIVEDHYHPEIRRMERMVLLEIVDSAWKDHLLAMDYLRSAVGQRGMAQLDPKVEYKREGMRMFEGLWTSIGERVTDLIFRMEQINEDFVSHTLVETSARHDDASLAQAPESDIAREQDDAINNSGEGKQTVETIRNRDVKVGRNDPCPCGSGKKYKSCCLRKRV
ncbi:MAG: SEC-C metal-binding domain-containing protein [Mariniblastus sp.]|nr:SEC-C metal-binding domain-containing protein [Mariniblastus sp.]